MSSVTLFLIAACRAIVEMLGLCLLGQGVVALIAGRRRSENPIYRLFALITRFPCRMASRVLPVKASGVVVGIFCFVLLFFSWIGLAVLRMFI